MEIFQNTPKSAKKNPRRKEWNFWHKRFPPALPNNLKNIPFLYVLWQGNTFVDFDFYLGMIFDFGLYFLEGDVFLKLGK